MKKFTLLIALGFALLAYDTTAQSEPPVAAGRQHTAKEHYDRVMKNDQPLKGRSKFEAAFFLRHSLKLTAEQARAISDANDELKKLKNESTEKNSGEKFDPKAFECENLTAILTELQYKMLLARLHQAQALKWAVNDWAELKQKGMTFGLDSATVVKDMRLFNERLLTRRDLYYNDKERAKAEQTKLYTHFMPPALKALRATRSAKAKDASATFVW